jgi:hypothetical protein
VDFKLEALYVRRLEGNKEGEEEGRTFPRASSAPSKKSITPKSMNKPPNVVSATPISAEERGKCQFSAALALEWTDFEHPRATS